jgi:hypothetical protein
MVLIKEDTIKKRHSNYYGINQITVADGNDGVFAGFIELAFHQTQNDVLVYEHAARHSADQKKKYLFFQLASRKTEVLNKLKIQRSEISILHAQEQSQNEHSFSRYLKEIESGPLIAIEDAFKFAIQRECRTLTLYKKLEKIMLLVSTKALFEYLVKSQYALMEFLSSQHSAAIAIKC